jgi:hypothetical protein
MLEIVTRLEEDVAELKSAIAHVGYAPKFIRTDEIRPNDGQAVWVRHRNGAEYRMTYPFNHKDYPLWYPLPKD